MPRRSSGGRPAPRMPRRAPANNLPQKAAPAQTPAPARASDSGGSMFGAIGSTIAQGMAFGTGSAVAHRAVDAVVGPRTIQHEAVVSETATVAPMNSSSMGDTCGNASKAFQDCLNMNGSDIGKCQFYLDMLNDCRRGYSGMSV